MGSVEETELNFHLIDVSQNSTNCRGSWKNGNFRQTIKTIMSRNFKRDSRNFKCDSFNSCLSLGGSSQYFDNFYISHNVGFPI